VGRLVMSGVPLPVATMKIWRGGGLSTGVARPLGDLNGNES